MSPRAALLPYINMSLSQLLVPGLWPLLESCEKQHLRLASKDLYTSCNSLIQHLEVDLTREPQTDLALLSKFPHCKHLTLGKGWLNPAVQSRQYNNLRKFIKLLSAEQKNCIRDLELQAVSLRCINLILPNTFGNLKKLELFYDFGREVDDDVISKILQLLRRCPSIEVLDLDLGTLFIPNQAFHQVISPLVTLPRAGLHNLQSLSLLAELDIRSLNALVSSFPKLTVLDVHGYASVDDFLSDERSPSLSQLESITLNSEVVSPTQLAALLKVCQGLQVLKVKGLEQDDMLKCLPYDIRGEPEPPVEYESDGQLVDDFIFLSAYYSNSKLSIEGNFAFNIGSQITDNALERLSDLPLIARVDDLRIHCGPSHPTFLQLCRTFTHVKELDITGPFLCDDTVMDTMLFPHIETIYLVTKDSSHVTQSGIAMLMGVLCTTDGPSVTIHVRNGNRNNLNALALRRMVAKCDGNGVSRRRVNLLFS